MNRFWQENWSTLLVIALMVVPFVVLRTRGDRLSSTGAFDAEVADGVPTLVEFYSNT